MRYLWKCSGCGCGTCYYAGYLPGEPNTCVFHYDGYKDVEWEPISEEMWIGYFERTKRRPTTKEKDD